MGQAQGGAILTQRRFRRFACIDWSGAKGPRQKGIAVAVCEQGGGAPALVEPRQGWSRQAALDWIRDRAGDDILIGVDFSAALPFADQGAYFPGWTESPADARRLWSLIERLCEADEHLSSAGLVDHAEASRHFRRHGGRLGDLFGTRPGGRLRVTEQQVRDRLGITPQSGFNLVGAAQVGKSSLTGMRLLHRLDGVVANWPFDPVPTQGALVVEIYTTIAARAAGVPRGRSKVRDARTLDGALAALGSAPHPPLDRYDDHSTDAILTAAWMRRAAEELALWSPHGLTAALAATEGWTFGVP